MDAIAGHRDGRWRRRRSRLALLNLLAVVVSLGACNAPARTPTGAIVDGEYGRARMQLYEQMADKPTDRNYLLDRLRVAVLTLADGYPHSAQHVFEQVYEILRTQGINRDRTVAAVALHEGVRIWKGEPFEQAMAMGFYAMQQAELGAWDNARAALNNSLFFLRDFTPGDDRERIDIEAVARRSLIYERAIAAGRDPDAALTEADTQTTGEDFGYVATESTFTLGYLLNGIANQQLGRPEEASDHFRVAVELEPSLAPLVETLRAGEYNTVLVVGWGLGPAKVAYGPDDALTRFAPQSASDGGALRVQVADSDWRTYPQVLDVNAMAADHRWRAFEEIRKAKSTIGTVMLGGGLVAAHVGSRARSDEAVIGGLAAAATGLLLKATSSADVRYADVMPQRFYVVPLKLPEHELPVQVQVERHPASRLILRGLAAPPSHEPAQLRYVALVSEPGSLAYPPTWAVSGRIFYGNERTGPAMAYPHPYILGGKDVRPPSERVLDDYQAAGYLPGFTAAELRNLYREEGLVWTVEDQGGYARGHVLEGGPSLVAPLAGTAGFARLFGQMHRPYRPHSSLVRDVAAQQQAVTGLEDSIVGVKP